MDAAAPTVVRSATHERIARDWALVLMAVDVPCDVQRRGREWDLLVDAADLDRAEAALAAYDEDDVVVERPVAAAIPDYGSSWAGVGMAVLLVVFARLTDPASPRVGMYRAGEAHAQAIVGGQWWLTVTALTLHADAMHLASNVAIGAVVATLVCWTVGPGVGAWLLLASGAAGNWVTAVMHGTGHRAVGASTAVFGGVGALVGFAIVRGRRRAWIPLAAGLALLGFLGTSERADLLAHFFGFVAGVTAGALIAPLPPIRSRAVQWLLALAALIAVVGCWLLAIDHVPRR
jgi:membrane associated rhomboid family serine protease